MRWPRRFECHFLMTKRLACNPAEDGSCLLSEHLSPLDESACNPKPKSWRQTGRIPFNLGHNDLANDRYRLGLIGRATNNPQLVLRNAISSALDFLTTSGLPGTNLLDEWIGDLPLIAEVVASQLAKITCPTGRQYIENRFQRQSASPGP